MGIKQHSNLVFGSFLLAYAYAMRLALAGQIPHQKWEIWTLRELVSTSEYMALHWEVPIVLSGLYLVLCFAGQRYMATRKSAFDLRLPLASWSLFLGVFSLAGSLRTVPPLVHIMRTDGWHTLVCGDTRQDWVIDNPAGFWTFVFCVSKIPELLDTAFIVARRKSLITLHWYHHFTVMLFCWQSWTFISLNGLVFAAMNLTVHTIMYVFYCLTALGFRPNKFSMMITLIQILQMVVGTAVTGYVLLDMLLWHPVDALGGFPGMPAWFLDESKTHVQENGQCIGSSGNMLCGFLMYLSYFGLFVHFFIQAYCSSKSKAKED